MRVLLYIMITLCGSLCAISQENLIANGSFEEFAPIGLPDELPPGYQFAQHLEPYWYQDDNDDLGFNTNLRHIAHQIDCWSTYKEGAILENPAYEMSSILVLSANQGPLYLSNPNSTFLFGFPYTHEYGTYNTFGIGQNVLSSGTLPTNSDSYIAMITHRWQVLDKCQTPFFDVTTMEKPKISSALKEELVKDRDYTFKIDLQKIAHLNTFCSTGGYDDDDDKNPNIKIRVFKSVGIGSKTIFHDDIESTSWDTKEIVFHVNSTGYDRIEIILDKSHNANRGVFIDNVQLYDACETPENTCENPELFKSLLDIDIHSVEIETTIDGAPATIKSVEVTGLKVATYAKITITNTDGTVTYKTIFEGENPPDIIVWDGKNDLEIVMPNVNYKCKVEAYNLCYPMQTFTKKFKKELEIQLFDPLIVENSFGGVTISGLEEVVGTTVIIEHVLTDAVVFWGHVVMPENSIGWNGSSGNNFTQLSTPQFLETGYYRVIVILQSKCGYEAFQEIIWMNEAETALSFLNGNYSDPLYEWEVINDKYIPECDFYINNKPFYRVPKDCCVGDLFLDDDSLWGDMTFNILGTIYINNDVDFAEGSIIIMNAGEGFVLEPNPDGSALVIGSDVSLIPSVICDCDCNKSSEIDQDSILIENITLDSIPIAQPESKKLESVKITPNPATDFVSVLIPESKNYANYEMYNSKGELILNGQVLSKEFRIDISKINAGEYFIRFSNDTERETLKLIVQ